jgi:hypothetical protein
VCITICIAFLMCFFYWCELLSQVLGFLEITIFMSFMTCFIPNMDLGTVLMPSLPRPVCLENNCHDVLTKLRLTLYFGNCSNVLFTKSELILCFWNSSHVYFTTYALFWNCSHVYFTTYTLFWNSSHVYFTTYTLFFE